MTLSRLPRLYSEYAEWFPLLSPVSGYQEEAQLFHQLLDSAGTPVRTVLELGAGGGHNAYHLSRHYQMTLTDISSDMLRVSQDLNPTLRHIRGDMRDLRLEETFDAVFSHDAISYMATLSDLKRAVTTAAAHLRPGGIFLAVPDYTRETFRPRTRHGGSDQGIRGVRYLEWVHDPHPLDSAYAQEMVYLFRYEEGEVISFHERHRLGLYSQDTWLRLMDDLGLTSRVMPLEHSEMEENTYLAFVGIKR